MQIRIYELSKLIHSENSGVFDVGSDHGYLLLLLRDLYPNISLKGVENKKGPFNNLKKNTAYKNINISLSDGLDDLTKEYTCVVLAGMGFNNINQIINKNLKKLEFIHQIIIDSHTNIDLIRKFIVSLGYYIDNEKCLIENGIYYELISFSKGEKDYSEFELKYGPILLKEKCDLFINHYKEINKKIFTIMDKLDVNSPRYQELKKEYLSNERVIEYEN